MMIGRMLNEPNTEVVSADVISDEYFWSDR